MECGEGPLQAAGLPGVSGFQAAAFSKEPAEMAVAGLAGTQSPPSGGNPIPATSPHSSEMWSFLRTEEEVTPSFRE